MLHSIRIVAISSLTCLTTAWSSSISIAAPIDLPWGASQLIDHAFASISLPAHFFADYAGNKSHPNLFSRDILDLLYEKSGARPYIRVGGTSADHTVYNASQKISVLESDFNANGIPGAVSIGPVWFEGFENFPGTQWTFQVNMWSGLENALSEARLCMDHAKDSLAAFEIGNEPDIAVPEGEASSSYTLADYVADWLDFADAISEKVLKGNTYGLPEQRFFQALTYSSYDDDGFSVQGAFADGINTNDHVKSISQHQYDSGSSPTLSLQNDFMNHFGIVGNLSRLQPDIDFIQSQQPPIKYTLGETNSDYVNLNMAQFEGVFGSTLWLVDYLLYGMTRNISHMNLIQGTTFGYAAWVPVPAGVSSAPYVRPPLYGQIMIADILGHHPEVQIKEIELGLWNMSAYAVYEGQALAKFVIVNLDEWSVTMPGERPQQSIELSFQSDMSFAKIERLVGSLGADADTGISWAGQSWNYTAKGGGRLAREGVAQFEELRFFNGKANLTVASSEAVVVTLKY